MKTIETSLKGCYLINSEIHQDKRGSFVKTFHENTFYDEGLETHFAEEYFLSQNKAFSEVCIFKYHPMITLNWFIAYMEKFLMR